MDYLQYSKGFNGYGFRFYVYVLNLIINGLPSIHAVATSETLPPAEF